MSLIPRAIPARIAAATLVLALALAVPAARADTFRCGSSLAKDGDTIGHVLHKCGQPTEVQHKSLWRPAVIWRNGRPYRVGDGDIEVAVEIWTYNLGPNKFMRRLTFEDGTLVEVETLGYGYPSLMDENRRDDFRGHYFVGRRQKAWFLAPVGADCA